MRAARRVVVLASVATIAAGPARMVAQPQTADQQQCTSAANKSLLKIATTLGNSRRREGHAAGKRPPYGVTDAATIAAAAREKEVEQIHDNNVAGERIPAGREISGGLPLACDRLAANGPSGLGLVAAVNNFDVERAGDIAFIFFLGCE